MPSSTVYEAIGAHKTNGALKTNGSLKTDGAACSLGVDGVPTCKKYTHGNKVTVDFPEGSFIFHSQWLHDARCDDGADRNAKTAICQQSIETVHVESVQTSGTGVSATLDVAWDNRKSAKFPIPWLRAMALVVASKVESLQSTTAPAPYKGWKADTIKIPEVSYNDLFQEDLEPEQIDRNILAVLDKILSPSSAGIVKVVDLPPPIMEDEHNHVNNINTKVLKKLFGSVFVHPIRGKDTTFNVSSHSKDAARKVGVSNYDTSQVLLPHTDHAFYDHPAQVMGFYGLESTSLNTWVSALAVLDTLKSEDPEAYGLLCNTPMALGRISHFYGDALSQATFDTAVMMQPGRSDVIKRVRWHPHLTGTLLSPYEQYKAARLAHLKFEQIMRRDTHQLKIKFQPGDYYVWDNFRLMHGREAVIEVPRTGVGQTVPEPVVHDRYRALATKFARSTVNEEWLVHMPMPQLRELLDLVQEAK